MTRSKRLHQESKADSTSLSRVMAAVANQVHSTAQQIGARIGWNPIDAATQPPQVRVSVSLSFDPRTDHRDLGFEDSWIVALRIQRSKLFRPTFVRLPPPGTRISLAGSNESLAQFRQRHGTRMQPYTKRQKKRDTAHAVSLPTSNLIYLFSLSDPAPNSLRCATGRAALAAATAGIAAAAP